MIKATMRTLLLLLTIVILWMTPGRQAHADDPVAQSNPSNLGVTASDTTANNATPSLVSVNMSTGSLQSSYVFTLPQARGRAQPALSLAYDSNYSREGEAGLGWHLTTPTITRHPLSNAPNHAADPTYGGAITAATDRFEFNGQPLVPICTVGITCPTTEAYPNAANGWHYYRLLNDDGSTRFFWNSPELGSSWLIENKSGVMTTLGYMDIDAGAGFAAADRWLVTKVWDSAFPANFVTYVWNSTFAQQPTLYDYNAPYLSDIYYSPVNAQSDVNVDATQFAYHVRLNWEHVGYPNILPQAVLHRVLHNRLAGVDVTAASWNTIQRVQLRRYHLAYNFSYPTSGPAPAFRDFLTSITLEGRCTSDVAEGSNGTLPSTNCPTLPPYRYTYGSRQLESGSMTVQNALDAGMRYAMTTDCGINCETVTCGAPDYTCQCSAWADQCEQVPFGGYVVGYQLLDVNMDGLPDIGSSPADESTPPILFNIAATTSGSFHHGFIPGDPTSALPSFRFPYHGSILGVYTGEGHMNDLSHTAYFSGGIGGTWRQEGVPYAIPTSTLLGAFADLDGDGLNDGLTSQDATHISTFVSANLTHRTANGKTAPYVGGAAWLTPITVNTNNSNSGGATPYMADMDGDGFADMVEINATPTIITSPSPATFTATLQWRQGDGHGHFASSANSLNLTLFNEWQSTPTTPRSFAVVDVTNDGIADVVYFDNFNFSNGPGVEVVVDPAFGVNCVLTVTVPPTTTAIQFADVNGNGTTDLVASTSSSLNYWDFSSFQATADHVPQFQAPDRLARVDNGLGLHADIQYALSTDQQWAFNWQTHSPVPTYLVESVTKTADGFAPNAPLSTSATYYTFIDPVFDGWQNQQRGFRHVTTRATSGTGATNYRTEDRYYIIDECAGLGTCAYTQLDSDSLKNMPPLLAEVDVSGDTSGQAGTGLPLTGITFGHLSTTTYAYTVMDTYPGVDGRDVMIPYVSQQDTYLYDTTHPASGTQTVSGAGIASYSAWTTSWDGTHVTESGKQTKTYPWSATLPQPAGSYAHLKVAQFEDTFGNPVESVDYGCIEGCSTADQVITTTSYWTQYGDWSWRAYLKTVAPHQQDSSDPASFSRTFTYSYDSVGNPTDVYEILVNTKSVLRSHADPNAAFVSTAPNATSDGTKLIKHLTYDPNYGNATELSGPSRCVDTAFDRLFNQFPVNVTQYVSGACGDTSKGTLLTAFTYDRGLQAQTQAWDPNNAFSFKTYDGFGRPWRVGKPAENGAGADTVLQYDYYDVPNGPWQGMRLTHLGTAAVEYALRDGANAHKVSLKQANVGDGGAWVVSGDVDVSEAANRTGQYLPFFISNSDPLTYNSPPPLSPVAWTYFDAYGRAVDSYAPDLTHTAHVDYHALSKDNLDGEQLNTSSPHYGKFTTESTDGHLRPSTSVQRVGGTTPDVITTTRHYQTTGEVSSIRRTHQNGPELYLHTFEYDSIGRLVRNVEPNSGVQIYAYDDAGDLVGTSDARGCGVNAYYDGLGRLVSDDYSPCLDSQEVYSAPMSPLSCNLGAEDFYQYDVAESGQTPVYGALLGRVAAEYHRGSRTQHDFDFRGRERSASRRMAYPTGSASNDDYGTQWFTRTQQYDQDDRPTTLSTGADATNLLGSGTPRVSTVTRNYDTRGNVGSITSSYGSLVSSLQYDADDQLRSATYADVAGTVLSRAYDAQRRLNTHTLARTAGWSVNDPNYSAPPPSPPTTLEPVLESVQIGYDFAGNPTGVTNLDGNLASWPSGALPRTTSLGYDDLYRLTTVGYGASDTQTSPYQSENNAIDARPIPQSTALTTRVAQQTYQYDWLDNTQSSSSGDPSEFWDRSLGDQHYGATAAHQLASAHGGLLTTNYDAAGNLVNLVVRRAGTCTGPMGYCAQRFVYDWDEVGNLHRARRWDYSSIPPTDPPYPACPPDVPTVDVSFVYDGQTRALKVDSTGSTPVVDAEIFSTLRLAGASWTGSDYDATDQTEAVYLDGVGRVVFAPTSVPTLSSGRQHVFFMMPDHGGSKSIIVDRDTSELVEKSTYQAFGAIDADYRPGRWDSFREPLHWSGKVDDFDIGAVYFGQRYYGPNLGMWLSPDPVAVNGASGDLNVYRYSRRSPLRWTDPFGLDAQENDGYGATDTSGYGDGGQQTGDNYGLYLGLAAQYMSSNGMSVEQFSMSSWDPLNPNSWKMNAPALTRNTQYAKLGAAFAGNFYEQTGGFVPTKLLALSGLQSEIDDSSEMAQVSAFAGHAAGALASAVASREYSGELMSTVSENLSSVTPGVMSDGTSAGVNPVAGSIRTINATGGTSNCVACAIATDASLGGSPASAVSGGPFDVVQGVTDYRPGAVGIPANGPAGIRTMMANWGPGSRGIVWGTRGDLPGHAFNVVNQGGMIRFLDGQTGGAAVENGFQSYYLFRTQ